MLSALWIPAITLARFLEKFHLLMIYQNLNACIYIDFYASQRLLRILNQDVIRADASLHISLIY